MDARSGDLPLVLFSRVGSECYDRDLAVGVEREDSASGLQAVHARHMDIEKCHIDDVVPRHFYRIVTVFGGQHTGAHITQQVGDQLQIDRVVVGREAHLAV